MGPRTSEAPGGGRSDADSDDGANEIVNLPLDTSPGVHALGVVTETSETKEQTAKKDLSRKRAPPGYVHAFNRAKPEFVEVDQIKDLNLTLVEQSPAVEEEVCSPDIEDTKARFCFRPEVNQFSLPEDIQKFESIGKTAPQDETKDDPLPKQVSLLRLKFEALKIKETTKTSTGPKKLPCFRRKAQRIVVNAKSKPSLMRRHRRNKRINLR